MNPLTDLLKPAAEYLKGQPFNNVMIAVLTGVIVYFNMERAAQTEKAHSMVHSVIKDIREEGQANQDRLIFAMKGVKYEVAKTRNVLTEVAAGRIPGDAEKDDTEEKNAKEVD
jgi:hypothetical protein